jgi:hypothetical protein
MAEKDNSIGANAWVGNSVSAPKEHSPVPLSSDMPPLSGKSITSVPEEHRFDRVPKPMTNTNPEPPFLAPGEALDRLRRRMADKERETQVPEPQKASEPVYYQLPNEEAAPERGEVKSLDKKQVFEMVKNGLPSGIYDGTVIPLIEKGLVRLDFVPGPGGMLEVIAVSTKDNQPLRAVGFAQTTEKPSIN